MSPRCESKKLFLKSNSNILMTNYIFNINNLVAGSVLAYPNGHRNKFEYFTLNQSYLMFFEEYNFSEDEGILFFIREPGSQEWYPTQAYKSAIYVGENINKANFGDMYSRWYLWYNPKTNILKISPYPESDFLGIEDGWCASLPICNVRQVNGDTGLVKDIYTGINYFTEIYKENQHD